MSHISPDTVLRYLQGTLGVDEKAIAEVHMDECDDCRRLVAESAPTATPRSSAPVDAAGLPTVPMEHYIIEEEVARGGLGKILRAHHVPLGRVVAVKELIRQSSMNLDGRFVREALVTAGLQHPGIVPLYEAGRWPTGEYFYSMKLVEGETLAARIRSSKTFPERIALLPNLIAVGEALAYAHSRRVVHRDIKPSNILLGEFGETVLIDWGLAKEMVDSGGTRPGEILGTPLYMAPEQSRGAPADPRSDVYSFGLVLYEMLAGVLPYADLTPRGQPEEFVRRISSQPMIRLSDRVPNAPTDLVTIVHKALAVEPEARYPTAKELVDDLLRFETGQLVSSRSYSAWELVGRWASRRRTPLAIVAASVATLVVLGAHGVVRIDRARRQAEASVATLHLEQGRLANLRGDPLRSLVYLGAAAREGKDGPALRFLARRAEQALERRRFAALAHTGVLQQAAYSPDGARIATAGQDRTVALWDAGNGTLLHRLAGHTDRVVGLSFSPDGKRLATGSHDKTVRLWDADSGTLVRTLTGHQAKVIGALFSPEGSLLISRSEDGVIRIWDAAGELVANVAAHEGDVPAMAWFPDGRRFVTAGADRAARVWRDDGTPMCVARGHTRGLSGVGVSPNGDRFVTASYDQTAIVWTFDCRQERGLGGHRDAVLRAAFDPAGMRIVTAGADGTAKLWQAGTGQPLASLEGHGGGVVSVAFSSDGTHLLTASDDRTARIWTGDGRQESIFAGHLSELRGAVFSPDEKNVAAAVRDGTLVVWDARPEGLVTTIPSGTGPVILARFLPDGGVLAISEDGDGLCPPMRPDSRSWATGCELSLDGSTLIRAEENHAVIIDVRTRAEKGKIAHPAAIRWHALSPRGDRALTGSADGTILLWESQTGRILATLQSKPGLRAIALSPDTATLVIQTGDEMTLWDLPAATPRRSFPVRVGRIAALEFDARGERFAGPTLDGSITVWDARTGIAKVTLEPAPTTLVTAVFSPNGQLIATAGQDGRTRIYDAATGALLSTIAHGGLFCAPQFSADGTRLVTAGSDGTAKVWDVSSDARGPAALAAYIRCHVPFRLEGAVLWPAAVDPASCQ